MAPQSQAPMTLQGITLPNLAVDPGNFFRFTRRQRVSFQSAKAITGLGSTDRVKILQDGILGKLYLRVYGTHTWGGTITGSTCSWKWPYGVVSNCKLTANGQSGLISLDGTQLKLVEVIMNPENRGPVSRSIGSATGVTSGTLSLPHESWGVSGSNQMGPGVTVPATGAYTYALTWEIPVAFDDKTLIGAIFAQTSATDIELEITWETQANMFTVGGSASLTSTYSFEVLGEFYSIPNVGGTLVVPELFSYHGLVASNLAGISSGEVEHTLPGTGVGKQLMRLIGQVQDTNVPLAVNSTNYGKVGWRYGANTTPEDIPAQFLNAINVQDYGENLGLYWGYWVHDFAHESAFRDSIDESTVTSLRNVANLASAPSSGKMYSIQQTLFSAAAGS